MKIKELAEELDVTPQAIQKRMSSIKDFRKIHTKKIKNRVHIDPDGVAIIKKAMKGQKSSDKSKEDSDVVAILKDEIDRKQGEIDKLLELLNHSQQLQLTEHKQLIELKEQTNKKGIWKRIKAALTSNKESKDNDN